MLYLLIILRTGRSCTLCTMGFLMSVCLMVTISLYPQLIRSVYEAVVGNHFLGVGSRHASDGAEGLRKPGRVKAVNVSFLLSDLAKVKL